MCTALIGGDRSKAEHYWMRNDELLTLNRDGQSVVAECYVLPMDGARRVVVGIPRVQTSQSGWD
jgi:hypothetical protein